MPRTVVPRRKNKAANADVLVNRLVEAHEYKEVAISDAQAAFGAVQADVIAKAQERQRAIEELQASLALEHTELDLVQKKAVVLDESQ